MGTIPRQAGAVIQFHEDHYTYDAKLGAFVLDEPTSLLGDLIVRTEVTEFRASQGWTQITTITLDEGPVLGVIDVWTRTDEPMRI